MRSSGYACPVWKWHQMKMRCSAGANERPPLLAHTR